MDKCPGLIGGINDPTSSCNIQSAVQEQIDGVLSALPGNNPVTGWATNGAAPPPAGSSSSAADPASSGSPSSAAGPASSGSPSSVSGGGYGYPSSPPSAGPSSSVAGPGHIQSTSSAAGADPSVPYSGPPSGPAAPASTAPGTAPGSPGSSACAVVTVTTTMTAWYTAAAASATAPSSAGPTNPTIPNWWYNGCYTDVRDARVLSGTAFADLGSHNVTTTGCVSYCDAAGYSIAGTEYAGQCFCGNALANASTKVADGKCNMACEGDASQLCGGGLVLTVYTKGSSGSWKGKGRGKRGVGQ
jgi:WSC domain